VSFEFLHVDDAEREGRFAALARSPMERAARAAGASFEQRDGWNVAVRFSSPEQEAEALARSACFADVSHLGKLELQAGASELAALVQQVAGAPLEPRRATRAADAWWCPLSATRALVISETQAHRALRGRLEQAAAERAHASVIDVTTTFAALRIAGPLARELFARFCALDLRPKVTPPGSLRPGSIARQPGILIAEAPDRYLILFGWATGEYMWTVLADAGERLGARPVGVDALGAVEQKPGAPGGPRGSANEAGGVAGEAGVASARSA
jgi:sarcosine oxidase subunit gamma